jgi:hypothetical protein
LRGTGGTSIRPLKLLIGLAAACGILIAPPSAWAVPDTFRVNDLGDAADMATDGLCDTDGGGNEDRCTLRAAIEESNANADVDAIKFAGSIAGTACQTTPANCTITVTSPPLPNVTDPVTINGCSSDPNRVQPCVGVEEPTHTFTVLLVNTENVTTRGLAWSNLFGGLRYGPGASNGAIKNNWFGLDLDGTADPITNGLFLLGNGNTIGGPGGATGSTPADRNVFAANTGTLGAAAGLVIFDGNGAADNNVVQGNYFGTDAQGAAAVPNGDNIDVYGASGNPTGNVIGGDVTGTAATTPACDGVCNVIAAADGSNNGEGHGIELGGDTASDNPAQSTSIKGNHIGTDVTGTVDLGNTANGVNLDNPNVPADGDSNAIGGSGAAGENLISNSGGAAIRVTGSGSNGNLIARNRGSNNGGQFIDLGPAGFGNVGGPNAAIAAPTISSGATSNSVGGSGATPNATVRVYRTTAAAGADPNGITAFVGHATANGSGNWALSCPGPGCAAEMPGSGRITANQSSPTNNSSELAKARAYSAQPPNTTITSGPGGLTNDRTPTFGFSSNEAGSTFQCGVDGGAFASCSSPHATSALDDGDHTFRARARDTGGNLDPTPAARSFTVDATAPETTIDKAPKKKSHKRKAKFKFSADEPSSFECKLDKKPFKECDSPFKKRVKRRKHKFRVRAIDQAGNVDATPAKKKFKVLR